MLSSLMCAVGLAACCGLVCLKDQPQIKAAITESPGNNVLTTPVVYGEFVIDDTTEYNFGGCNFDSTSPVAFWDTYLNYCYGVFETPNGATSQGSTYNDLFPYGNNSNDFQTKWDIVTCCNYSVSGDFSYLSITFAVNTQSALALSSDGVNVYFDIYTEEFNIPITDDSFYVQCNYFDTQFVPTSGRLMSHCLGSTYYNDYTNDIVGANPDYSPVSFDWEYEYWDSEDEAYVTGKRLGFTSSFVNTNTNGINSMNQMLLWNHVVYTLIWDNTDMLVKSSPFGDSIFCSYSMKGLETNSNGAYLLGYNSGYSNGYEDGVRVANEGSYANGYSAGYADGQVANFSWNGLFGAVADTPLIMLRGMFNFDLFGMNVLSVLLSLVVALVAIKVVMMILRFL